MFEWSEWAVIGVVALIVIGPKELPAVLRTIGQWTTKIRRMAGEFQNQFQEAMREAEMADLKKQVDELGDTAKGLTSDFGPLDLKEENNSKPKTGSASETPPEASAAAPSETRDPAVPPSEPIAAAPPVQEVGSTSEPSAVPLAEA
jgi:sec-independent protein translocase protein TatB